MKIEVVQTIQEFEAMEQTWNQLLNQSASHVPFLRHEYLLTWWRTLGGGEWKHGDLHILLGRDTDGILRGIAPFFLTQSAENQSVLMLLGSFEVSDYLDVIAKPEDLSGFLQAVFSYLKQTALPWQTLEMYNLAENSPTLPILAQLAEDNSWHYDQQRLQPAPFVTLAESWDAYLAGIKKKQRHEIRRKMRRADELGNQVRWYIVDQEAHLDHEIDDFLQLMAYDPVKKDFLTATMRQQMQSAIHTAFNAGWLQLAFLEVDGQKAAGYLNFDFDNRIWVYNSGLNTEFRALSPGWVLLGHLIEYAIQQGREVFDFLRGDEEYKYRFGGVDRFIVQATIQR